ncbi:prephenate dehydratase [Priestia megaterium]|uniref:prephenate dehydratase n=1 Tax=Priestia megaterium TaxID=1404 RepID=UPI00278B04C5|nr:prephenate dehydratase [Priestia megaterium]MDQ0805406.1 prephenate dehydratase [Priestia megaterium]
MKVAYLGPQGTFSEEAAFRYFSSNKVEWLMCESILDVLDAVKDHRVDKGLVPIENSIEGTINMTADGLLMDDFFIEEEVILPVSLNLLTMKGVEPDQIEEVWSIPPALAQCRNYIRELRATSKHFNSTASAAKTLRDEARKDVGAIGSEWSARMFDLQVTKSNIQDHGENCTRFVLVGRHENKLAKGKKTMLVVTPNEERPGLLAIILNVFSSLSINLTWIESRPTKKKLGTYRFFIETEMSLQEERVRKAITILETYGHDVLVLGSYNTTKL